MALFSKEPEKSTHHEQSARPHAGTAQAAPPITPPAPAAAYLDRGTKISGKLHFEGPARIDGNIDGEIDGKEITIGESAVATSQIRADSIVVCWQGQGRNHSDAANRDSPNRENHRQHHGSQADRPGWRDLRRTVLDGARVGRRSQGPRRIATEP